MSKRNAAEKFLDLAAECSDHDDDVTANRQLDEENRAKDDALLEVSGVTGYLKRHGYDHNSPAASPPEPASPKAGGGVGGGVRRIVPIDAGDKKNAPKKKYERKDKAHGQYWIVTSWNNDDDIKGLIPEDLVAKGDILWARGQREQGAKKEGKTEGRHWQFVVCLPKDSRLRVLQRLFGDDGHYEVCANPKKAEEYCTKPETAIAGTQFEIGDTNFAPRNNHGQHRGSRSNMGSGKGSRSELAIAW